MKPVKLVTPMVSELTRFASKFKKGESGCWLWTGCLDTGGYGLFSLRHKTVKAHRVCYTVVNGEIPNHLQLDHLCRNRRCVNPKHLEAVTGVENVRRGNVRKLKKICRNGHEFTTDNIYWVKDDHCVKGVARQCRICCSEKSRRWRLKNANQ